MTGEKGRAPEHRCKECGERERYVLHDPVCVDACDCRAGSRDPHYSHHAYAPEHRGETERWTLHDNGAGEAHLAERRCNYECGLGWKNVEVVPAAAYEEAQKEVEFLMLCLGGISHWTRCSNHYAGHPDDGLCMRCQLEAAEAKIAAMRDVVEAATKLDARLCDEQSRTVKDQNGYANSEMPFPWTFEDEHALKAFRDALAALRDGTK